jgi:hypothetical protein
MTRMWTAALALLVTLAIPAVSLAHDGHAHKVMGTVSSVDGKNLMVKTTDGKSVMVMMDAKTKITRGKAKADAADLKVGERIVAEGAEDHEMIMATSVQLATAPATTAKK